MKQVAYTLFAALVLTGCPPPPPPDSGADVPVVDTGIIDAGGPRGIIRWGTVACREPFDGGAPPPDVCEPVRTHISNTGVMSGANPDRFRCSARVQLAD